MRSVIVCEGTDDFEFIANYLEQNGQWVKCEPSVNLLREFELPLIQCIRGKAYGQYTFGNDKLVIWSVGGKDAFSSAYKYLNSQVSSTSSPDIDQIFFFLDRDQEDIATVLAKIEDDVKTKIIEAQTETPSNNIQMTSIHNNQRAEIRFEILGENFLIYAVPIVIPFDRNGSLEDILMQAIIDEKVEGDYIVEQGNLYINSMGEREEIKTEYFKDKPRLEKKALFSAIMSVISPTRPRTAYSQLLNSVDWHNDSTICEYLNAFDLYLKSE